MSDTKRHVYYTREVEGKEIDFRAWYDVPDPDAWNDSLLKKYWFGIPKEPFVSRMFVAFADYDEDGNWVRGQTTHRILSKDVIEAVTEAV